MLRKMEYLRRRCCVDCGEWDPLVLEFDHRGRKSKAVADLVRSTVSWKRIEQEMAKCEIRCANCHRRKTARERGWLSVEALEPEAAGPRVGKPAPSAAS